MLSQALLVLSVLLAPQLSTTVCFSSSALQLRAGLAPERHKLCECRGGCAWSLLGWGCPAQGCLT